MKIVSSLSGYLVKILVGLGLVLAAAIVGVGVAASVAYHQIGGDHAPTRSGTPKVAPAEVENAPKTVALSDIGTWEGQAIMMNVSASLAANRFIAAALPDSTPSTYANYSSDAQSGAANTADAPPSLEPAEVGNASTVAPPRPPWSEPGSRYIVDPNTGVIIGVDGTAGARAEARQQPQRSPDRTTATGPNPRRDPEVLAALPLDTPATAALPPAKPEMFPAIRRAEAVDGPASDLVAVPAVNGFNAVNELSDDRPVFRAQPVTISQPVRTQRRIFALP